VASADGVFAVLAVAGGAGLAAALAVVAQPLRWLAFAVLLGLAARIAATGLREPEPRAYDVPSGPTYAVMLGATLLNPATVVYFAALVVAGGGAVGSSFAAGASFVAGAFLASASWQLLLATGGSALGRTVTSPAGRRAMALLSAALVAGLAVSTLV
jgi:arginine exporter protein ArgO